MRDRPTKGGSILDKYFARLHEEAPLRGVTFLCILDGPQIFVYVSHVIGPVLRCHLVYEYFLWPNLLICLYEQLYHHQEDFLFIFRSI